MHVHRRRDSLSLRQRYVQGHTLLLVVGIALTIAGLVAVTTRGWVS